MKHTLKKQKLRNSEYYDFQAKQDELYERSLNGETFGNLMNLVMDENNIKLAYRNIKKNSGSYTPGTDGKTIQDIAKMEETEFVLIIKKKLSNYHPKRVRRVEIPKVNGTMRPLGIPTIIDRIVQQCILQVMEPICEAKFHDYSFGFRPNRSTEHAIAASYKFIQNSNLHYVVNVDIKGFFDNVNHKKLLRQIWSLGIRDTQLLMIIKEMLRAEIEMPDGTIQQTNKGTPQGGILSPLLANIVLNELDWWISSQWEQQTEYMERPHVKRYHANGSRNKWSEYNALRNTKLKEMFIVRYADDFKIFCRNKADAHKTMMAVEKWLKERLKLEVSKEKTSVANLRKESCEFLGFNISVRKKGDKYVVISHISQKSKDKIKANLKKYLKEMRRPKSEAELYNRINDYNSAVIGIQNYYAIATMVSVDLTEIAFSLKKQIDGRDMNYQKRGKWNNKYLQERYGCSKQVRWSKGIPILPLGYVQHKHPMNKRREVNQYTAAGRALIHKNLGINIKVFEYMMKHPVKNRSVEYNDNRMSLYAGQNGKCAVTEQLLEIGDIHCHHIIPKSLNGTDEYKNLVLVTEDVHSLIHATNPDTIQEYCKRLRLSKKQINKLNKFRKAVGNKEINSVYVE